MRYKFSDLVTFARTGLNPRKNFVLQSKGNPYITIKNIKNGKLIIDENTDYVDDEAIKLIHRRSKIQKGDILFASIGRIGDMYIIDEDPKGWDINESVFAFTLNTKIVRQKYFYYLFKSPDVRDYLLINSSGSTFTSIKMNQLARMEFNIPSLEEQDKVIDILSRADRLLENQTIRLSLYDELIRTKFSVAFDALPKDHCLGDVVKEVKKGQWGDDPKNNSDDTLVIKTNNMEYSGEIHYEDAVARLISKEKVQKNKLDFGDILVEKCGGTKTHSVGYPCLYLGNDTFVANNFILVLSANKKLVNPYFIQYQIRFMYEDGVFDDCYNKTTGIQNLKIQSYLAKMVCVPDLKYQEEFATFVMAIDKLKKELLISKKKTQEFLDSKMCEFFSGEEK